MGECLVLSPPLTLILRCPASKGGHAATVTTRAAKALRDGFDCTEHITCTANHNFIAATEKSKKGKKENPRFKHTQNGKSATIRRRILSCVRFKDDTSLPFQSCRSCTSEGSDQWVRCVTFGRLLAESSCFQPIRARSKRTLRNLQNWEFRSSSTFARISGSHIIMRVTEKLTPGGSTSHASSHLALYAINAAPLNLQTKGQFLGKAGGPEALPKEGARPPVLCVHPFSSQLGYTTPQHFGSGCAASALHLLRSSPERGDERGAVKILVQKFSRQELSGVQDFGAGRFEIFFKTKSAVERFLNNPVVTVREQDVGIDYRGSQAKAIRVLHYPNDQPDEALCRALGSFGQVHSCSKESVSGFPGVWRECEHGSEDELSRSSRDTPKEKRAAVGGNESSGDEGSSSSEEMSADSYSSESGDAIDNPCSESRVKLTRQHIYQPAMLTKHGPVVKTDGSRATPRSTEQGRRQADW
ncbi:hypothetical protein HPB48_024399 [Haemaphysalis longicornis]|uniref:Uncharacterized protein n=1 Tax=Haemaphysalis longicornis TaxID=44386 RepID=A0A9J6GXZ8_HAELO|nr:hypothetical protein HPB48_024399 [Haemaphysalis longicornis]